MPNENPSARIMIGGGATLTFTSANWATADWQGAGPVPRIESSSSLSTRVGCPQTLLRQLPPRPAHARGLPGDGPRKSRRASPPARRAREAHAGEDLPQGRGVRCAHPAPVRRRLRQRTRPPVRRHPRQRRRRGGGPGHHRPRRRPPCSQHVRPAALHDPGKHHPGQGQVLAGALPGGPGATVKRSSENGTALGCAAGAL